MKNNIYVRVSMRTVSNRKRLVFSFDRQVEELLGNASGLKRYEISMLDYKTFEIQTSDAVKKPNTSSSDTVSVVVPEHIVDYSEGADFKMKQFKANYNDDDNTITFECDVNQLHISSPILPTIKAIKTYEEKQEAGFDPETAWGVPLDSLVRQDVMERFINNMKSKAELYE